MIKLSVQQIIKKIQQQECFHAVAEDYSFTIKIEEYVPYICAAVHDGHQFRKSLWHNCRHTEYERWYEEDPCTKEMVAEHPIVIAGCDSRFEYDLNRAPETAVYTDAWGKQLWKAPLADEEIKLSLAKHTAFYEVVNALLTQLESLYKTCVVYDIHSYNWKRWDREVPTWNLGTANIDRIRFSEAVDGWLEALSSIKLPQGNSTLTQENNTFQGHGYFLKYISENFKNTLVLATELKKVYCNEVDYIIYPEVVTAVKEGLSRKIKDHVNQFFNTH